MAGVTVVIQDWDSSWKDIWVYIDPRPDDREWKGTYHRFTSSTEQIDELANTSSVLYVVHPPNGKPIVGKELIKNNQLTLLGKSAPQELTLHFWHRPKYTGRHQDKHKDFWEERINDVNTLFLTHNAGIVITMGDFQPMTKSAPPLYFFSALGNYDVSDYNYNSDPKVANVYLSDDVYVVGDTKGVARSAMRMIGLAEEADCNLLAHEIGHLMGLSHISYIVGGITRNNFMNPHSCDRSEITFGQIVWAHYSTASCISDLPFDLDVPGKDLPCMAVMPEGNKHTISSTCLDQTLIGSDHNGFTLRAEFIERGRLVSESVCWNDQFAFDRQLEKLAFNDRRAVMESLGIA